MRLEATDVNGTTASTEVPIEIHGMAKVGIVSLSFVDLSVPLSGVPIAITRSYDSRVKSRRDFGVGWELGMKSGRFEHNRTPGVGWSIHENFPPPSFPCTVSDETQTHYTTVRLSDREWYRFRPRLGNLATSLGSCFADVSYEFVDGLSTGATLEILSNTAVVYVNGSDQVIDDTTGMPWEPDTLLLTTYDGRRFTLREGEGITEIQDTFGNSVTFTPTQITHSSGRAVTFVRDAQHRITQINDPNGERITYGYDAQGDLTSVTDQGGHVTSFSYDDQHRLLDVINAVGARAVQNEFDASGRLVASIDAYGRRVEFAHDLGARAETTTDRLGNVTVHDYDTAGNVTRKIDALGHQWLYTYDSRGNELSTTDPLGRVSTRTFDTHNNLLTATDEDGNRTQFTRNARGQVLSSVDARGRTTTNTYGSNGDLLTSTDGTGAVTHYTNNARGEPLTITDPPGRTTTLVYDAQGNVTSRTNPLGHVTTTTFDTSNRPLTETRTRTLPGGGSQTLVTTHAYDALGHPTTTTDALGNQSTVAWDALGKPSVAIAKNGLTTYFVSDNLGLLTRIEHDDGTADETTYDAEGRVVLERDREGNETTHEYDALGRRTRTTYPDGSYVATTYDAVGRVLTQRDERGNITTIAYGVHTTTTTDALGHVSSKRVDSDGNVVRETDALGHTTRYTYDLGSAGEHGQGRLTRVDFADGTYRTIGYDTAGQKTSETDELGHTTSFAYDAAGRLASVTDTAGAVTLYTYDQVGNRISIVDAKGHVTHFEYDGLGRLTRRILPAGQSESMSYDAMGNMTSKTDFNGATSTFGYDSQNRMNLRQYAGAAAEAFTYSALGRRLTAGAESFSYDARGRLLTNTKATGEVLSYAYDMVGNRTSVSGPHGTTSYTFDALNRLSTVAHNASAVATYGYDAAGRQTTLIHGNGLVTTQSFDARDRLLGIETRTSGGGLVSSYSYTRDLAGRISAASEAPWGRSMSYGYDTAYRLASEAIVDPAAGNRTIGYSYDPAGNRTFRSDSVSGLTSYAYDADDRLLTETASVGVTTYSYDANGNVVQRAAPAGTVVYGYDARNLMTSAVIGSNTYGYSYDVEGARITRSLNGGLESRFLVDSNMPHAHVLRETSSGGAEIARQVYGVDEVLYSVTGAGGRYMHYDAQRSVRALTNSSGAVVDNYAFDAFGRRLANSGLTVNAYGYSGERRDAETGLIHLRARQYDSGSGRLLGRDSSAGVDFLPLTRAPYVFAANSPLSWRDPSGRDLVSFAIADSILGILVAMPTLRRDSGPTSELQLDWTISHAMAQYFSTGIVGTDGAMGFSAWWLPEQADDVAQGWRAIQRTLMMGSLLGRAGDSSLSVRGATCVRGGGLRAHVSGPIQDGIDFCPDFTRLPLLPSDQGIRSQAGLWIHEISHLDGVVKVDGTHDGDEDGRSESNRVSQRLQMLRRWSHGQEEQVRTRSA